MRWGGRVARLRGNIKACGVFVGKPEGKYHLNDLGVDGGTMG
jgi:hypothetical protein